MALGRKKKMSASSDKKRERINMERSIIKNELKVVVRKLKLENYRTKGEDGEDTYSWKVKSPKSTTLSDCKKKPRKSTNPKRISS